MIGAGSLQTPGYRWFGCAPTLSSCLARLRTRKAYVFTPVQPFALEVAPPALWSKSQSILAPCALTRHGTSNNNRYGPPRIAIHAPALSPIPLNSRLCIPPCR